MVASVFEMWLLQQITQLLSLKWDEILSLALAQVLIGCRLHHQTKVYIFLNLVLILISASVGSAASSLDESV